MYRVTTAATRWFITCAITVKTCAVHVDVRVVGVGKTCMCTVRHLSFTCNLFNRLVSYCYWCMLGGWKRHARRCRQPNYGEVYIY